MGRCSRIQVGSHDLLFIHVSVLLKKDPILLIVGKMEMLNHVLPGTGLLLEIKFASLYDLIADARGLIPLPCSRASRV